MFIEEKAGGEEEPSRWPEWLRIYGEPCVIAYHYGMWASARQWDVCKNYVVYPSPKGGGAPNKNSTKSSIE